MRDIEASLQQHGLELTGVTEPDRTGPAHITLVDPDCNPILIDQFFDRPS